jgi:DinB superfamily
MTAPLADVADALTEVVAEALPRLHAVAAESARPWGEGKWTRQQVLGHLIDSALNNYHRVIRAQQGAELRFPDYDQRHWVDAGAYGERDWMDLVQLWSQLNRQLAHAIARVSDAALGRLCHIGAGAPETLEFIVRDYPRHLQHHLRQILDAESATGMSHPPFTEAR